MIHTQEFTGGMVLRDGDEVVGFMINHKGVVFDSNNHRHYYYWYLVDGSDSGVIQGYQPARARETIKAAYLKSKENK